MKKTKNKTKLTASKIVELEEQLACNIMDIVASSYYNELKKIAKTIIKGCSIKHCYDCNQLKKLIKQLDKYN